MVRKTTIGDLLEAASDPYGLVATAERAKKREEGIEMLSADIEPAMPEPDPVQVRMDWNEAAELHETLSKQWHNGIVAEFVRTLGERLKERPKT